MRNTANGRRGSVGERRKEPRFIAKAEGRVTVLSETLDEYRAVVVDVSRSGLQLELDNLLERGAQIRVEFSGLTVVGKVANLRPHGAGRYRVGVLVNCVAESRYEAAMTFGLQMLNERCGRPVELAPRALAFRAGGRS